MTSELYSQPNNKMKGGWSPKSHYSKETFAKKIYNTYTSYRKLETQKMTLKEFYLRKLLQDSLASMFDRLVLPKKQAYKKIKGAQVNTPSISSSKFKWRETEDEEMTPRCIPYMLLLKGQNVQLSQNILSLG